MPRLTQGKNSMTSSEQSIMATAPDASNAVSAAPTSPAPAAPTVAAKPPAKKVASAPAKKVATAVKPVAKAVTPKAVAPKAAVKSVFKATPTAVIPAVAKAAPKVAVKVAAKAPGKTSPKTVVAPAAKPKVEKLLKAKKPKLVRDSFTIPKLEYLILEELKQRSGKLGNAIKKSELIRAGIKALAAMSDASFTAALKAVPAIKTGRPAKD